MLEEDDERYKMCLVSLGHQGRGQQRKVSLVGMSDYGMVREVGFWGVGTLVESAVLQSITLALDSISNVKDLTQLTPSSRNRCKTCSPPKMGCRTNLLKKSSNNRFRLDIVAASSFAFDCPLTAYSARDCLEGIGGMMRTGYNPERA